MSSTSQPPVSPEALITNGLAGEALMAIQGEIITSADIYHLLVTSQVLRATGDLKAAISSSRRALEIDPHNTSHILNQTINLAFNGDSQALQTYCNTLCEELHASHELQGYLQKLSFAHNILSDTTFSSSSSEAGRITQPSYIYADTNTKLRAPVRIGINDTPYIKSCSAVYDPTSRCWYESENGLLIKDLLQSSWNAEGFAFESIPRIQLKHEELMRLKADSLAIDEASTFMPIINHFGHFLTQCSPYLSFLSWIDSKTIQTLITNQQLPTYAAELLAIHPATQHMRIISSEQNPIFCKNLIFSQQMWHEWHYASCNAFRFLEDVARIILDTSTIDSPSRIYVSRSRVKTGLRISVNEEEVEARLRTKGFHAIHPQDLTLKEAISIFSRADTIIGHAGSAMHNLIFSSRSREQQVYYLAHELPAYNFHMVDCVKDFLNPVYLRKGCTEIKTEGTPWLIFYPDHIAELVA
jgi:capsular polysaccharide biosynthesis protein